MPATVTLSVRIPPELHKQLRAFAEERQRQQWNGHAKPPVAAVVIDALRAFLPKKGARRG